MNAQKMSFVFYLYISLNLFCFILTETKKHSHPSLKVYQSTPDLPKSVEVFNAAFKNEVEASKNLTRLFDISNQISPSEFLSGKLYLTMAMGADIGSKNAVADAILLVRFIPAHRKKFGDHALLTVYSNSIAKSLHKLKVLDEQNSETFAKLYARMMDNTYEKIVNKNYPRSNVAALTIGFFSFVKSQFEITDAVKNTFDTAYSDEWRKQFLLENSPEADKEIPPISSPAVNPLLSPDARACKDSEAVRKFQQIFSRAVGDSETLQELFKPLPRDESFRGTYYVHLYLLQRHGVEDPAVLADFVARYIGEQNTGSRSALVSVLSKSRAKYLESEGVLNPKNVERLALRYARVLENTGKSMTIKEYPRARIVASSFGSLQFLKELNVFDSSRGKKYAFFLGNEWRCQN